jgi:hypothetical protein
VEFLGSLAHSIEEVKLLKASRRMGDQKYFTSSYVLQNVMVVTLAYAVSTQQQIFVIISDQIFLRDVCSSPKCLNYEEHCRRVRWSSHETGLAYTRIRLFRGNQTQIMNNATYRLFLLNQIFLRDIFSPFSHTPCVLCSWDLQWYTTN